MPPPPPVGVAGGGLAGIPPQLLLQAIVASSDDAIYSLTPDGVIASWNPGAERVYGYRSDEVLGRSVFAFLDPTEAASERRMLDRVLAGERLAHVHLARRRRDGSTVRLELSLSPVKAPDGAIVGISKIARDMEAELAAQRGVQRLAAIVDSSDDAIISKDTRGFIDSWNRGAEQIFGYTAAEVVGKHVTVLFPPDRLGEEDQIMARILRGERIRHYESVRRRKDGTTFPASISISPILDGQGQVVGAAKILRDITEERLRQVEQHQEQEKELEQLRAINEFKTTFLNTAAHELNTPLTPMKIELYMLRRHLRELPRQATRSLDTLQRSEQRLSQIVHDLLEASRLQAQRVTMSPSEADLVTLVKDALRAYESAAKVQGVELVLEAPARAPLRVDSHRISQVLDNLISNALKFTKRGKVTVSVYDNPDGVVVRVQDTGVGLAPEKVGRLFRPFSQVHDTMQVNTPGTGLGLYIAKGIVELHGGQIWAESGGPGRGTTFIVSLPRRTAAGTRVSRQRRRAAPARLQGARKTRSRVPWSDDSSPS